MEVEAMFYAANAEILEGVCKFFKIDFPGAKSLVLVKELCRALEREVAKLKDDEIESYLDAVREIVDVKLPETTKKTEAKPDKMADAKLSDKKTDAKTKEKANVSGTQCIKEENAMLKVLSSSALRRQFKISGQIGDPDQRDKLSFTSLVRQILNGNSQGYTDAEIVDGVIRAITPGMTLRNYLETYKELTLERLKKILKSHYGVKNTTELYQSLAAIYQGPKEHKLSL